MVKKKYGVKVVPIIGLVLVIRNKKWKEILYLYACGYRPYQSNKKYWKLSKWRRFEN